MADLPITNISNSESIKTSQSQINTSVDIQSIEPVKIASQVLSKTSSDIVFSLPNQPPLHLDISTNNNLNQSINIGDKVDLSLIKDASTIVISITPNSPKPPVLLETPLSPALRKALSQETKLPEQESLIKAHLEKNTSLQLGQARRLPQEQITLKVNDVTTIKAPLPEASALPMNQTLQTKLVLNNQHQIMVQFTKLPAQMPTYQVAMPVTKLTSSITPTTLASLPISSVNDVNDIVQLAAINAEPEKTPELDMAKPLNQLWLRHQLSPPLFSQLSNTINEFSAKSDKFIHTEVTLNVKNSEALTKPEALTKSEALVKSETIAKQLIQPQLSPIAKNELGGSQNNVQPIPLKTEPQINTITTAIQKSSVTPPLLNTIDGVPRGDNQEKNNTVSTHLSELTTKKSLPLQKLNELIGLLQSQNTTDKTTLKANQIDKASQQPGTPTFKNDALVDTTKTATLAPALTKSSSDDNLLAINQLKALSKQVATQLPSMVQLTNPAQLSHLVEQFTRFSPLTAFNLNALGPLANALQLMLGSRHAAQGQALSPELLNHLQKILKQSGNSNHLTTALQMLGNLQSIKPLEESLTNLSSHIQFYQYQNAEPQTNQSLFYFNIPTKEPHLPQVEGEVEKQNNSDDNAEKTWRLTLLLPCGDNNKIKINALLTGSRLELDLTTNNESIVEKVDFYKDFLANRLTALGFEKATISCQQGDIPATLLKRPNQLVELMI